MGYMRHHAIVVTSYNVVHLEKAHTMANELFGTLVTPVTPSLINQYSTFFVAPDGSKEGWDESDRFDLLREQYTEWLNRQRFSVRWAVVQYGDDENETKIVAHSDTIVSSDNYEGPSDLK